MKTIVCPVTQIEHVLEYDASGNGTLRNSQSQSITARFKSA
ncbi:MAG: hypothetical protein HLUCCO02_05465 [Idiomarinaceae bacterium HL-53]|nr:MAG: hypothetical protein HLUCCO02_05465 [Idiomarinaceae bacterium HL-53]